MGTKRDIASRADIEYLLNQFYSVALQDDKIGFFFTEVVPLDLSKHIPVITSFWESILFNTPNYSGRVMEVHQHIHLLSPITNEHLQRWVSIFSTTVNAHFEGAKAELIKQRAVSIATIMQMKLQVK